MEEVEQEVTGTAETVAKEAAPAEEKQKSNASEKEEVSSKKQKMDQVNMPTRPYLDATVVPILLQALSALARERPQDPIQFLADFLVRNKSQYAPQTADVNE
ncbi:protein dpy-30 homolog [Uloborus diversus]|uniref:protein dpy-30 homolog n=1 Tax=Uloborus diversus TaxID=327109 RepID=UPI002409DD6C|nr:protein dpy-30 homolog [Uloborus diversus]